MKRKLLALVIFAAVLVALYLFLREYATLEWLISIDRQIREALDRRPFAGFFIGLAIYTGVSMVPGTTGKAIIAAWFYGFWAGLVLVNVGLTIAAMLSFFASRYLLREMIERRFGRRLQRINAALEREGAYYLFIARVLHAPYSVTNYVMGATSIRAKGFWPATQLGLLPGNLVYVYAGSQLPNLQQLAKEGVMALISPGILFAFVAVSVLPLIVRWIVMRLRGGGGTPVEEELADEDAAG